MKFDEVFYPRRIWRNAGKVACASESNRSKTALYASALKSAELSLTFLGNFFGQVIHVHLTRHQPSSFVRYRLDWFRWLDWFKATQNKRPFYGRLKVEAVPWFGRG